MPYGDICNIIKMIIWGAVMIKSIFNDIEKSLKLSLDPFLFIKEKFVRSILYTAYLSLVCYTYNEMMELKR